MVRTRQQTGRRRGPSPSPSVDDTVEVDSLPSPRSTSPETRLPKSGSKRKRRSNNQPRKVSSSSTKVRDYEEDDDDDENDVNRDHANGVFSSPPQTPQDGPSHDEHDEDHETDEFYNTDTRLDDDDLHELAQQSDPSRSPQEGGENRAVPLSQFHFMPEGNDDDEDTEPPLSKEQQKIIELIKQGKNVFFTGSAGSGKSRVLKAAVKALKKMETKDKKRRGQNKQVHVVTPTGISALQVDGITLWSYMGWTPNSLKKPRKDLVGLSYQKHVMNRMLKTDALVFDEISMLENHILDRMSRSLNQVRAGTKKADPEQVEMAMRNMQPFNGIQVIATGDFCQLPPVLPFQHCKCCGHEMRASQGNTKFACPNEKCEDCGKPFYEKDKWAFKSEIWDRIGFEHVHLDKIHRQEDTNFIRLLQDSRLGKDIEPEDVELLMDHPCEVDDAIHLFCTKDDVAKHNDECRKRLPGPETTYQALDGKKGNWKDLNPPACDPSTFPDGSARLFKRHRFDDEVKLRKGMLVVLQVNLNIPGGLCNGSQGVVEGFEDYHESDEPSGSGPDDPNEAERRRCQQAEIRRFLEKYKDKKLPRVRFHNGDVRVIEPWCMIETFGHEEPHPYLHRTQIPLMPGWALSVHKSQGMTLDRVIVDLSRAFEEGQVYVALSRARSLYGLKIEGDPKGLRVGLGGNDEVREFLDAKFPHLLHDRSNEKADATQGETQDETQDETEDDSEDERPSPKIRKTKIRGKIQVHGW